MALTLVAVAVLAAGALLGTGEAYARPCCSSCDSGYHYCVAGCNGDPTCEANCEANCDNYWFTHCYRWCSFGC